MTQQVGFDLGPLRPFMCQSTAKSGWIVSVDFLHLDHEGGFRFGPAEVVRQPSKSTDRLFISVSAFFVVNATLSDMLTLFQVADTRSLALLECAATLQAPRG